MSNIPQIITKEGTLADVPAGRRVLIDPGLLDGHSNELAPDDVTVSTGFEVTQIVDDSTDPLHGCFYIQNMADHTRDLAWTATYDFSKQHNPNTNKYPVQTTVGTRGESGGSAEGVDPIALQGTAIGSTYTSVGSPNIEQVNNKLIFVNSDEAPETINLPTMTADQEGMEVTIKDLTGNGFTVDGGDYNIDGAGTWTSNSIENECVTLVFAGTTDGWLVKEHYHVTGLPEQG